MSIRSNSSHLFSPLRDPKSLIRRRNLGEPSSFFDFKEVMNNNHNHEPPPQNGPPPMDTINAAAGGTFMQKTPEECYELIENMTAHHNHWDTSTIRDETSRNISSTSTTESPEDVRKLEMMNKNFSKMMRQFQTIKAFDTKCTGSLPSNTVPNAQEYLKVITTRSGVTLAGPSVSPSSSSKEVDREPETITNQVLTETTNNVPPLVVQPSPASISFSTNSSPKMPEVTKDTVQSSTKSIQPPVVQTQNLNYEPVVALKPKSTIPYPSRVNKQKLLVDYVVEPRVPLILGRPFLRTERALIDVYGEELTLCVDDEAITFKVGQTSKYFYSDAESINRIAVIDVAYEDFSLFPSLTPFEGGDFILEEIEAYLTSKSIPPGIDDTDLDLEGDIRLLEELLNNDPSLPPLPPKELNVEEIKTGTNKLPVIIAKDLKDDEKEALLKVLKSHKRAIAWKISDIKDIDPRFYTHKILMEDDFKPTVQSQRLVNPKVHDVIKKEVIKLLVAGMIYLISDSPWLTLKTRKRLLSPVLMEHLLIEECLLAFAMLLGPFKDCIDAFDTLKKKLTEAPIVVPD
uniref:Reverse transcriptase domain-containing protein n=1 Tax=Tanacetum cinerariifolium TaxID=118510 RepID=A0A699H3I6_TANCI|nr:reverse transcriptase domain-containing protein [Tanacetum cinerariifolium]